MRSRPRNGRAQEPRETAEHRIFEVAIEAFAEKGFHGTSTRDIAQRAGLSSTGLYVYYDTKEDLFFAVAKVGHEIVLEVVRSAVQQHDDPIDQLFTLTYDFVLTHATRYKRGRVVNYQLTALSPDNYEQINVIRREIEEAFLTVIENGISANAITATNAALAARSIISLGVDVARWYQEGGTWSAHDIAAHHAHAALRIVGARRAVNPDIEVASRSTPGARSDDLRVQAP